MISAQSLLEAMASASLVREHEDGFSITTHCIYPTGEFVRVRVYGRAEAFIVSDEGNAVRQVESAGATLADPDRTISRSASKLGLMTHAGILRTRAVTWQQVPYAIAAMANASQKIAEELFDKIKVNHSRDFKLLLKNLLEVSFPANVHPDTLTGSSNRTHRFESVINLDTRRLIIDPVVRDASAINARVVANIDIKRANIPMLDQRIVYDDQEDWTAAELNLLQFGAPLVPYSRLPEVLPRLAALH